MIFFIIFLALIIGPILLGVQIYNKIQRNRISTEEGWSGIGTMLQQRNDVIPNLVETVKGYASHERGTLEDVIKWRNQSASAKSHEEQNFAENGLQRAMAGIYAVAENYPDLKANANFMSLQSQLMGLEEKINAARNNYNGRAREFNTSIAVFPNNVVASFFDVKPVVFFTEETSAQSVPKVKF